MRLWLLSLLAAAACTSFGGSSDNPAPASTNDAGPTDGGPTGDDAGDAAPSNDAPTGAGSRVIASGFQKPLGLVMVGDWLYVGDARGVVRLSTDGNSQTTIAPISTGARYMVRDPHQDTIYFTTSSGITQVALGADGTASSTESLGGIPAESDYAGIAISGTQIYYTRYTTIDPVHSATLSNGQLVGTTSVGPKLYGVEGIAATALTVFVAQNQSQPTGLTAYSVATNGLLKTYSSADYPDQIALVDDTTAYVTYQGLNGVEPGIARVHLETGAIERIVTGAAAGSGPNPGPTGITVSATMIYWCDYNGGTVMGIPRP